MKLEKIVIGDKKVIPITIPSGIVMTDPKVAERLMKMIPEIGIWTTKSIGSELRAGNREPILYQYNPRSWVNAVGLTNPGCEKFNDELTNVEIPKDRFVLGSIFGGNVDEFIYVAETLIGQVDGLELNLSCPHVKGHGMQLGQDSKIVYDIVREVVNITNKPVIAKLTPNTKKHSVGKIADAAIDGGAYGICAINTVGPGKYTDNGFPVLSNGFGGLSGDGILPLGLKAVEEIRSAIGDEPLVIGMGGIKTADDAKRYFDCGANVVGIGSSALPGMNEERMKDFFFNFVRDIEEGTNNSRKLIVPVSTEKQYVKVAKIVNDGCQFKVYQINTSIKADPGQFVMAGIDDVGEKPFSVMDDNPLTLGVLEIGEFTKQFNAMDVGNEFYFKGPYGVGLSKPFNDVVLVGGGCGIAGLYLIGKRFKEQGLKVISLLGAKDLDHLVYLHEFTKLGETYVATEDGSWGQKGMVGDLFSASNIKINEGSTFYNCGPKAMIEAVLPLEFERTRADFIFSSLEYMTRCGVGVCGSCAGEGKLSSDYGKRTCVEGPFMRFKE